MIFIIINYFKIILYGLSINLQYILILFPSILILFLNHSHLFTHFCANSSPTAFAEFFHFLLHQFLLTWPFPIRPSISIAISRIRCFAAFSAFRIAHRMWQNHVKRIAARIYHFILVDCCELIFVGWRNEMRAINLSNFCWFHFWEGKTCRAKNWGGEIIFLFLVSFTFAQKFTQMDLSLRRLNCPYDLYSEY